ncbi:16S rRNA (guanine(966)-N(2))-methyltransferase RsmD [Aerococcaceae bacterium DSM 111022]|nr:16S rRNA (guanine(966)-N(2))-methyltransferase RsmD [Aerococcaceae bacterium DSM 111022]
MRVISGEFGSRPLKAVPGKNTRPTTDKIKESIFNLIQPFYENNQCLDFYGGTGALGIEAVSRGFEHSVIIEKDRKAIQTIKDNIKMTKAENRFTLLEGNNHHSLTTFVKKHPDIKFDLIFLDPPYHLNNYEADISLFEQLNVLHKDSVILCESDDSVQLPERIGSCVLKKHKAYRQTHIWIYSQEK